MNRHLHIESIIGGSFHIESFRVVGASPAPGAPADGDQLLPAAASPARSGLSRIRHAFVREDVPSHACVPSRVSRSPEHALCRLPLPSRGALCFMLSGVQNLGAARGSNLRRRFQDVERVVANGKRARQRVCHLLVRVRPRVLAENYDRYVPIRLLGLETFARGRLEETTPMRRT
jgi:hypothetical protein